MDTASLVKFTLVLQFNGNNDGVALHSQVVIFNIDHTFYIAVSIAP